MKTEHITEGLELINQVNENGGWFPASIVAALLSLIIFLLLSLYKRDRKFSEIRIKEFDKNQKSLIESNQKLTILIERFDVRLNTLESTMK
tara:strand:- start:359 stop:631 length:273 start_codon:yes stop_codon:yes gene_type:complete